MTTRRQFLQILGAGSATAAGLVGCGGGGGGSASSSPQGPTHPPSNLPSKPILIVLQLDGGMDMADALVPIGSQAGTYASLRPQLHVPASATTNLGNGYGLNNAFTGMAELHALGRVAWLPGIGMNNPNLSHFLSQDIWDQGSATPTTTGWLGRYADLTFAPSGDPLRGIALEGLPLALRGNSKSFVTIMGASTYRFPATLSDWGDVPNPELLRSGFTAGFTQQGTVANPALTPVISTGKLYDDAQSLFATLMGTTTRTPSVPYPGDSTYPDPAFRDTFVELAWQLKSVAEMIAKGVPCETYYVHMGGFDTHSNHKTDYPNLLKALGGSLSAFYKDLGSITTADGSAQDRVMVVAWSEFGRRVQENNGGLDHGAAGLAFALGRAVKGGFYSDYPSLSNLDADGNLKYSMEFRRLHATVLDKWLRSDSKAILGGTYDPIGFL